MFKVFRYSSFVGLVAVVAVIVALSWFYRRLAFDSLIESETRSNVALTKTFANSIWQSYAHFVRDAAGVPRKDLAARAEVEFLRHDLKNLARDRQGDVARLEAVLGSRCLRASREGREDNSTQ